MSTRENTDDQFDLSGLPENGVSAIQNCPIAQYTEQAQRASKATLLALQRLRECLINCASCPDSRSCELHEHFNLLVDQSVAEIIEEWGW